jgi:hypothetical protein
MRSARKIRRSEANDYLPERLHSLVDPSECRSPRNIVMLVQLPYSGPYVNPLHVHPPLPGGTIACCMSTAKYSPLRSPRTIHGDG